jgi:lysylphosphatidylglycerol synthetase-like protein (DUF2156 family)
VRRHGDNSVAAFALDRDVDYFFSPNGRAVIAYRFESDTLLVIGDPIGPEEEIPPLLESFERFCREHDWSFAFYQARPERRPLYRARGWRTVHIGEDPVIPPRASRSRARGRDAAPHVRRLERQGIEARSFVPARTRSIRRRSPEGMLDQLREISPSGSSSTAAARRASAWVASIRTISRTCGSRSRGIPRSAGRGVLHLRPDLGAARLDPRPDAPAPDGCRAPRSS